VKRKGFSAFRHRSFDGGGRFWYNGIPTEGESGHLCQNLKEI